MAKSKAAPKHRRTPEEMEALIVEYEAVPEDQRRDWMSARHLGNWFHRMRQLRAARLAGTEPAPAPLNKGRKISAAGKKRIAEAQRERWKRQKAAGIPHQPSNKNAWKNADDAGKRALLAEHDALQAGHKKAWAKRHGVTTSLLTYWRVRFRKEGTLLPVVQSNNGHDEAALLAEYKSLPRGQGKTWLKEHGLAGSWAYNVARKFKYNGKALVPSSNHTPNGHEPNFTRVLPNALPPVTSAVSLDDAIAAMQVRQDLFTEFLDVLKRISRGGRL